MTVELQCDPVRPDGDGVGACGGRVGPQGDNGVSVRGPMVTNSGGPAVTMVGHWMTRVGPEVMELALPGGGLRLCWAPAGADRRWRGQISPVRLIRQHHSRHNCAEQVTG